MIINIDNYKSTRSSIFIKNKYREYAKLVIEFAKYKNNKKFNKII